MKTNIELAQEAGLGFDNTKTLCAKDYWSASPSELDRFATLVESRYRERQLAGAGEPVGWVSEGIAPHTSGRVHYLTETTDNIERRWWSELKPRYSADAITAERIKRQEAQAECERMCEAAEVVIKQWFAKPYNKTTMQFKLLDLKTVVAAIERRVRGEACK